MRWALHCTMEVDEARKVIPQWKSWGAVDFQPVAILLAQGGREVTIKVRCNESDFRRGSEELAE
jgi:hypothetical protein